MSLNLKYVKIWPSFCQSRNCHSRNRHVINQSFFIRRPLFVVVYTKSRVQTCSIGPSSSTFAETILLLKVWWFFLQTDIFHQIPLLWPLCHRWKGQRASLLLRGKLFVGFLVQRRIGLSMEWGWWTTARVVRQKPITGSPGHLQQRQGHLQVPGNQWCWSKFS